MFLCYFFAIDVPEPGRLAGDKTTLPRFLILVKKIRPNKVMVGFS